MPSASAAKLEKQASSEAVDPIKQGIIFVDHKIRNLMKKKGRLDAYKDEQKNGKTLIDDQIQALKKYDELCQNLLFAQEFKKQLNTIQEDYAKQLKKKEKKEAYEREQLETAKVKEILIIQDVLAGMGSEAVREDFLAGKNRAVQLTESELQYLDELFVEVSPKREPEEGQPSFLEQAQNGAKHLLSIVEGKDKDIVGTKYSVLRDLINKIHNCGYFDPSVPQEVAVESVEAPVEQTDTPPAEILEPQIEHVEPEVVPSATFHPAQVPVMEPVQPPIVETAGLYISQRPMADVLNNVMGTGPTPFNFIQESELESPEVVAAPLPPAPVPSALPIPTQTFTNTNFAAPPHVYQTIQEGPIAVVYPPAPAPQYIQTPPAPAPVPIPEPQRQYEPEQPASQTGVTGGQGDWSENSTEQNDWAVAVEQSEQNQWSEPHTQTQNDEWNDNSNDGFQPARGGGGRGRGRGGERGGRGGPRGNRGSSQNGRGGGGYYNRNDGEGKGNYYQNGYGSRGGDREGGYRDRGEGGYREKGEGGYRGDREGGYRGDREGGYRGDREGGYRGDREGGYRGDREGGYRGDREGGYRGDREGGYRGDREGGYRGRGGPRGGGQDRPRPDRGAPRGGRGAPRGNRGGDRGRQ